MADKLRIPKLPDEIVYTPFGDTIKITDTPPEGHEDKNYFGCWSESTGEIYINKEHNRLTQWTTLLHEFNHVIESCMIQEGHIKRRAGEKIVDGFAFNTFYMLLLSGMLKGFPPPDVMKRILKKLWRDGDETCLNKSKRIPVG